MSVGDNGGEWRSRGLDGGDEAKSAFLKVSKILMVMINLKREQKKKKNAIDVQRFIMKHEPPCLSGDMLLARFLKRGGGLPGGSGGL